MRTIQWGLEFRTQFRFWMVQSCSIGKWFGFRMPFEIRTKWWPFCPNHSKTEHHSKSDFKNVRFSNGFRIQMVGIRTPTVIYKKPTYCQNNDVKKLKFEKPNLWETNQFYEIKNSLLKETFLSLQPAIFYMHSVNAKNLSILYTCFTFCLHYNQHSLFLNELFILILYKKFYFCYNHV